MDLARQQKPFFIEAVARPCLLYPASPSPDIILLLSTGQYSSIFLKNITIKQIQFIKKNIYKWTENTFRKFLKFICIIMHIFTERVKYRFT